MTGKTYRKKPIPILASLLLALLLVVTLGGCASGDAPATEEAASDTEATEAAEQETAQVADASEMVEPSDVGWAGMQPIHGDAVLDGSYDLTVDSSSEMFSIEEATLTVQDGAMSARMTMAGTGYLYLFMGTAEAAAEAGEDAYIPYEENADGSHSFTVPVEALDQAVDCAAFSKKKEKWYARTLVFRADSLPLSAFVEGTFATAKSLGIEDGDYQTEVSLSGGSGKAAVESPCRITVTGDAATATLVWSSPNYDYMLVEGEKYLPVNTEGNSVFEIPVAVFGYPISVVADTTAMSQPYEISYQLTFSEALSPYGTTGGIDTEVGQIRYASEFSIQRLDEGVHLLSVGDGRSYLVLDEGVSPSSDILKGIPTDAVTIQKPLSHIYNAASSSMDFFCALDGLSAVTMTGTKAADWSVAEVREALERETIVYVGKYSSPDYEYLLDEDCTLAIESTMIYHTPKVLEGITRLGIPVLVERSSYETHPLGRLEWIKVYGLLLDKEAEAEAFFASQEKDFLELQEQLSQARQKGEKSTVAAFFSINQNGSFVVRSRGDYITAMMRLAGADPIDFQVATGDTSDAATMSIQPESFYAAAKDAEVFIYNGTIYGEATSVSSLVRQAAILRDCRAIAEGNVWTTTADLFQNVTDTVPMLEEYHSIFTGKGNEDGTYFKKLPQD